MAFLAGAVGVSRMKVLAQREGRYWQASRVSRIKRSLHEQRLRRPDSRWEECLPGLRAWPLHRTGHSASLRDKSVSIPESS